MPRDLSPLLPATVRLNTPVRACGNATPDGIPARWWVDALLEDAEIDGAGAGVDVILSLMDTAAAIYSEDTPDDDPDHAPKNQDHLVSLAKVLAKDLWRWRTVAFDREYAGIIAPDLDGLADSVEWSYREGDCSTRLTTAPPDGGPTHYNHADADDCGPGVGVYLSHPAASISGSGSRSLVLRKAKLRIVRGRLVAVDDGDDAVTLC